MPLGVVGKILIEQDFNGIYYLVRFGFRMWERDIDF